MAVEQIAEDFVAYRKTLFEWLRQRRCGRGRRFWVTRNEAAELRVSAANRITAAKLTVTRRANALFDPPGRRVRDRFLVEGSSSRCGRGGRDRRWCVKLERRACTAPAPRLRLRGL